MLQILHYSEKKFSVLGIWEGGYVPLPPVAYALDGLKTVQTSTASPGRSMEGPKVPSEGWELGGAKRRSADWLNLNQN